MKSRIEHATVEDLDRLGSVREMTISDPAVWQECCRRHWRQMADMSGMTPAGAFRWAVIGHMTLAGHRGDDVTEIQLVGDLAAMTPRKANGRGAWLDEWRAATKGGSSQPVVWPDDL